MSQPTGLTLIGLGAIGRAIVQRTRDWPEFSLRHVVVTPRSVEAARQWLGPSVQVVTEVPSDAQWVLECAGHSAIEQHVLPALQRGVECALLSIGALATPGLAQQVEDAARLGQTQVHVLSGAIGGIDAIAAARWGGLSEVTYRAQTAAGLARQCRRVGGVTRQLARSHGVDRRQCRRSGHEVPEKCQCRRHHRFGGFGAASHPRALDRRPERH